MGEPKKLTRTIPARKETIEILWCAPEFVRMSIEFRLRRNKAKNKMDRCFWCRYIFDDGDMLGLAAIQGTGNKVLCQTCVPLFMNGEKVRYG